TLMVQLNQAGHAFAGWFCTPPDNITFHAHLAIPKQTTPTALDGVAHGVLLGQFAEQPKFSWGPVPNEFEDPSQFFMKAGHTGTIKVINPRRLEMTIRRADDEVTLFLRQMEPTPRWSEAGMQTIVARVDPTAGTGSILATKIRQGLRAKQSVPVPQMYWNKIGLDMTEEGELGRLIIEHRATSGPEQDVVRAKINNYLRGLTGVEARYHELIRVHFVALANGTELEIDGEVKTVFDWLM